MSVYAPTAKATPGTKSHFLAALQDTLDKIAPSDILLLLGDFLAIQMPMLVIWAQKRITGEGHWESMEWENGIGPEKTFWNSAPQISYPS